MPLFKSRDNVAVAVAPADAVPIAAASDVPDAPCAVIPNMAPNRCLACGQEGHLRRSHRDCLYNENRDITLF